MAASENEIIVSPGETALIVATDGNLRVLLPDPDNFTEIQTNAVLLGVVAVRARDPEWVKEMLAYFEVDNADSR